MILVGDCREQLRELPDASVHTVVTSPPFWGLRDYGTAKWEGGDLGCEHVGIGGRGRDGKTASTLDGRADLMHVGGAPHRGGDPTTCACGARRVDRQVGLEPTPGEYVAELVAVFREVRRVLRDDGTAWLNLGDSYAGGGRGDGAQAAKQKTNVGSLGFPPQAAPAGYKPKELLMIPARVALALQADGWWVRSEIVWSKPNPMPESVRDRPTGAHEKLFLLAKSPSYFYDADAIREPLSEAWSPNGKARTVREGVDTNGGGQGNGRMGWNPAGRNRRNVWEIPTAPFADAHFATFPPALVEPCILAGCPAQACAGCGAPYERIVDGRGGTWEERKAAGATWGNVENAAAGGGTQRVVHGKGVSRDLTPDYGRTVGFRPACACDAGSSPGVVLDPFAGSGTVGVVAAWYGRDFVGIELKPAYAEMAERRIRSEGSIGRRAYRPEAPSSDQLGLLG